MGTKTNSQKRIHPLTNIAQDFKKLKFEKSQEEKTKENNYEKSQNERTIDKLNEILEDIAKMPN